MSDLTPEQLAIAARGMLRHPGTLGSRSAAILARQALEGSVDAFWVGRGVPAMTVVSWSAKFIALPSYLPEERRELGPHAYLLWTQLSGMAHHHPYEMVHLPEEVAPLVAETAAVVGDLMPAPGGPK